MEATNPKLRQFLKDAYTINCNHSIVTTPEQTGNIASIYNPITLN